MAAVSSGREAQLYWLALHLVPGLGARNALKLIRAFGSPEAVFHASLSELRSCGIREAVADAIHSGLSFEDAAEDRDRAAAAGAEIVSFQDPGYPPRLKEIYDPPILLYARGRIDLLGAHSIAIVGTRRATPYGRGVAEKLGRELSLAGLAIVSGLARGIDSAAHRGALAGSGATVAVLGNGIDVTYPPENSKLLGEIASRGLVVSEFPMGSTAFPQNFPIRNRVISGLGYGVMVVEGAQYSGSLITARLALDQGREVLAVPGSIASKPSWGPNLLIKQGAKLVQQAEDVIEEMPLEVRAELARRAETREEKKNGDSDETSSPSQSSIWQGVASPLGKKVFSLIRVDTAVHIDEVISSMEDRSPSEVLAALSELELYGVVRQLPGKHFVRIWSS